MASSPVTLKKNSLDLKLRHSPITRVRKDSVLQTEIRSGGVEIIEKISGEWTELCDEGASVEPFLRPQWFTALVKNFEKRILLITARRGGKLRAVLPLLKEKASLHGVPARKLQAVFNLNTQLFDLIHGADESEKKEIVEAVWKKLKEQSEWDVLEFRMARKDCWLRDLIESAENENYRTGVWQMGSAPFVNLPQGKDKEKLVEENYKALKKRFRQDLDRRFRRLKETGKVEFVVTRGYSAELMRRYFDLEAGSWKGRGGTAAACDARVVGLHEDFARSLAAENALTFYELKLDGKTIAMSINITFNRKMTFWKTAFDEKYARFSPGNLVVREFVADAVRNDSIELDMLGPASEYKKVWATGERELAAFYVFQRGFRGWLLRRWKFSVIGYLRKFKRVKTAG